MSDWFSLQSRARPTEVIEPVVPPDVPADVPADVPDDDVDDDLLPAEHRPLPWLTLVLAAAVLAAAGFAAGAVVQRRHDAGLTASPASAARGAFRAGEGFPAGGLPPGGGSTGGPAASAAPAAPAVVGIVAAVHGGDLSVKNFAGTTVVVHVPATAQVTSPGVGGVRPGMSVAVAGTRAGDGSITASAVTARKG